MNDVTETASHQHSRENSDKAMSITKSDNSQEGTSALGMGVCRGNRQRYQKSSTHYSQNFSAYVSTNQATLVTHMLENQIALTTVIAQAAIAPRST